MQMLLVAGFASFILSYIHNKPNIHQKNSIVLKLSMVNLDKSIYFIVYRVWYLFVQPLVSLSSFA